MSEVGSPNLADGAEREFSRDHPEYDLAMRRLREAVDEGEASGPAEPFDVGEFLREMDARYGRDDAHR